MIIILHYSDLYLLQFTWSLPSSHIFFYINEPKDESIFIIIEVSSEANIKYSDTHKIKNYCMYSFMIFWCILIDYRENDPNMWSVRSCLGLQSNLEHLSLRK